MANAARTSHDTGRNSASARDTTGTTGAGSGRGRQPSRGDRTRGDGAQSVPSGGETAQGQQTTQRQSQDPSRAQAQGQSGAQRADMERQVPVGRETQRQGGVSMREQGVNAAGTQRGTTPFSFMRRFGEEMDRLFEDFGFAPLGLDPMDLLIAPRAGLTPNRAVGGGTSGQRALTTGGAGLTRQSSAGALSTGRGVVWLPQVEVLQRGDNLVVRADLPGLRPEDVRVEVDNGALTISGERSYQAEDENEGVYHSERAYGAFLRTIPLPQGVNPEDVQARFTDGVLEVTIPLPKESRSKRIDVR